MKGNLVAPAIADSVLAKIIGTIYNELNALWRTVPETGTTRPRETEGEGGNIRVVVIDGGAYIQAKGPEGWVQVKADKVAR